MAAITQSAPSVSASRLTAGARAFGRAIAAIGRRAVTPHKAALSNLIHMPLSVAGVASVDFAAFHLAHGWGWLVTGVSLILLEHVIADDQ